MAVEQYQSTWKTYQDAWANIPAVERKELLRQSVAEDCVFTSPQYEGSGLMQLVARVDEFQKLYPGASFKTHKLIVHHDQLLAQWIMYDGSGAEFLPGSSYARFNADGQLIQLVGFWELP
jgi:hypothetical protein